MTNTTRRILFWILAVVLVAVALSLVFRWKAETGPAQPKAAPGVVTPKSSIDKQIESMSLDEKIGQLLYAGFEGTTANDQVRNLITAGHVGGVNILKRNVVDAQQMKTLTADLQSVSKIPLFIGTDQEGGDVIRFHFLSETTPESKITSVADAESIARERAEEIKTLGINMNFSPVAEYVRDHASYMFYRTFEKTPEENGDLAAAMTRGYTEAGMISVEKHFPGYGNAVSNPHLDAASSEVDQATYDGNIVAFRKVLETNIAPAVMVAHVIIPSVDPENPASSSPKFITGILRTEMGYKGLIMTDDMGMAAAGANTYTASVNAILAGADMVLVSMNPSQVMGVILTIKQAVQNGQIPESRIDESVRRVLALKSGL